MSKNIKSSPLNLIGGVVQAVGAYDWGGKRKSEIEKSQGEYDEMKNRFQGLDTSNLYSDVSNPYANMQNTMEDLTVNQQQAQFQAQQGAQQRANIMSSLSGAAGGSGIAGLAQAMANQGQLATQQASASIGQQESMNQRLLAQGAGREQDLERQAQLQVAQGEAYADAQRRAGAETSRGGMSQQRVGAANQARAEAKAAQMSAVGDLASAGGDLVTAGMKAGAREELEDKTTGTGEANMTMATPTGTSASGQPLVTQVMTPTGGEVLPGRDWLKFPKNSKTDYSGRFNFSGYDWLKFPKNGKTE